MGKRGRMVQKLRLPFDMNVLLNLSIVVLLSYFEKNTRCHSLYRPYSNDVPVYLNLSSTQQDTRLALLKKFQYQMSQPQEAMVSWGWNARMQTNVGTWYRLETRSTSHHVNAFPGCITIFLVNTFLPYSGRALQEFSTTNTGWGHYRNINKTSCWTPGTSGSASNNVHQWQYSRRKHPTISCWVYETSTEKVFSKGCGQCM